MKNHSYHLPEDTSSTIMPSGSTPTGTPTPERAAPSASPAASPAAGPNSAPAPAAMPVSSVKLTLGRKVSAVIPVAPRLQGAIVVPGVNLTAAPYEDRELLLEALHSQWALSGGPVGTVFDLHGSSVGVVVRCEKSLSGETKDALVSVVAQQISRLRAAGEPAFQSYNQRPHWMNVGDVGTSQSAVLDERGLPLPLVPEPAESERASSAAVTKGVFASPNCACSDWCMDAYNTCTTNCLTMDYGAESTNQQHDCVGACQVDVCKQLSDTLQEAEPLALVDTVNFAVHKDERKPAQIIRQPTPSPQAINAILALYPDLAGVSPSELQSFLAQSASGSSGVPASMEATLARMAGHPESFAKVPFGESEI